MCHKHCTTSTVMGFSCLDLDLMIQQLFPLFHRLPGVLLLPAISKRDLHAAIRDSFALVNSSLSEGMSSAILEVSKGPRCSCDFLYYCITLYTSYKSSHTETIETRFSHILAVLVSFQE